MYNIRFTDSGHSVEIGYILDRIDVMNIRYEGGRIRSEWGKRGGGQEKGGGREEKRGRSNVRSFERTVVRREKNVYTQNYTFENIWPYVRAKMKILGYNCNDGSIC